MTYSKAIVSICVLSMISCPSFAQKIGKINGAGTTSCGKYLVAYKTNDSGGSYQAIQWAYGFLSAYNLFGSNRSVELPEWEATAAYLNKYCTDFPLSNVAEGSMKLIKDLGGYDHGQK